MPKNNYVISREKAEVFDAMGIPYEGYVDGVGYQSLHAFALGSCYFQNSNYCIPHFQPVINASPEEKIKSLRIDGDDLMDKLVKINTGGEPTINMGHGKYLKLSDNCEIVVKVDDGERFRFGYRDYTTGKEEIISGKLAEFEDVFGESELLFDCPCDGAGTNEEATPWYSIYNWPALGSSARTMDALYDGNYLEAGIQFLTCAAEVFTFGYASTAGAGTKVTTRVAKSTVENIHIPAYRVYGGASKINGWSWSPINTKLLPKSMYRKWAGLPDVNLGTGYIKGSAKIKDMTLFRKALPLDGNPGGFPELIINPNNVNMWKYMSRPGNYSSYWGF